MKKAIIILVLFLFVTSICWTDLGEELYWAVYDNYLTEAEELLEEGADVNLQEDDGDTALIWATSRNHIETVEILKNAGAEK